MMADCIADPEREDSKRFVQIFCFLLGDRSDDGISVVDLSVRQKNDGSLEICPTFLHAFQQRAENFRTPVICSHFRYKVFRCFEGLGIVLLTPGVFEEEVVVGTKTANIEVDFGGGRKGFEEKLKCTFENIDFVFHTAGSIYNENDFGCSSREFELWNKIEHGTFRQRGGMGFDNTLRYVDIFGCD